MRGRAVAETVGSLVDKIIIVELKIFHMQAQADRDGADQEFRDRCLARVDALKSQRDALADEVTALAGDLVSGRVVPQVFRQFKMYNDPSYRRGTSSKPTTP